MLFLAMLIVATPATANDAPAMYFVPEFGTYESGEDTTTIDLMVNTSESSMGAYARIHFDPEVVNITDVNFSGSPWQPLVDPGWSHQTNYTIISLTNFSNVEPGTYKLATLTLEIIGENHTSEIGITRAEPSGVIVYNGTISISDAVDIDKAIVSIGDCWGTASIPIMVSNITNLGAAEVTLSYNPEVVVVSEVLGSGMDEIVTNMEDANTGWVVIGVIQTTNPGVSGDVVIAQIAFEPVGEGNSTLILSSVMLTDETPDCNTIPAEVRHGKYHTATINGDVNGDGAVNMWDVAYLAQWRVGLSGYEINPLIADVNGDGTVNMSDAMYLAKHILGSPGYEVLK